MYNTFQRLQRLMRSSSKILRKNLEPYGLHRGQPKILHVLSERESMSKKAIAERFEIAMPTVTKTIERLEKNGFVKSAKDQSDKRKTIVSLTDLGKETEDKLHTFKHTFADVVFKDLSANEIELLDGLIQKMQKNIDDYKEEYEKTH